MLWKLVYSQIFWMGGCERSKYGRDFRWKWPWRLVRTWQHCWSFLNNPATTALEVIVRKNYVLRIFIIEFKQFPTDLVSTVKIWSHRTVTEGVANLNTDPLNAHLMGSTIRNVCAEWLTASFDAKPKIAGSSTGASRKVHACIVLLMITNQA